jgi:hypothetical protein
MKSQREFENGSVLLSPSSETQSFRIRTGLLPAYSPSTQNPYHQRCRLWRKNRLYPQIQNAGTRTGLAVGSTSVRAVREVSSPPTPLRPCDSCALNLEGKTSHRHDLIATVYPEYDRWCGSGHRPRLSYLFGSLPLLT